MEKAKKTLGNFEQIAGLSFETCEKDIIAYLEEKKLVCSPSDAVHHALKQQLGDYADERLLAVADISFLLYENLCVVLKALKSIKSIKSIKN